MQVGALSERHLALDRRATHEATLTVVKLGSTVHSGAVIPDHEVTDPPLVSVDELRLGSELTDLYYQAAPLVLRHTFHSAR